MTRLLVVGGTHSGCGKTLVSLALMSALVRRGLRVQSFKVGPDFIDPGHHELVTGRPGHNLDGWMTDSATVQDIFTRHTIHAPEVPDVAIIEGVMGLHDGASGSSDAGSTAEIAKWLNAPVLLVADARSMARSAAALVQGYAAFDPDLSFAGVVFNRVGSENHSSLLAEAMQIYCPDIHLAGCLQRDDALAVPSRHLGLITAQEHPLSPERREAMADWIESGMDIPAFLSLLPQLHPGLPRIAPKVSVRARIGVARDAAFCFYYSDNLRLLEEAGAELCYFSPLTDEALPEGVNGLYFGGGYPEVHAEALADNNAMRQAVRRFSESGSPVYAECGGFMYLMQGLRTAAGTLLPMCGCFAMQCRMDVRFRALGYREITTMAPSIMGEPWTVARGHEFHYSHIIEEDPEALAIYKLRDRRDWRAQSEGFVRKNTLGSYVHLHFASNPGLATAFVNACANAG
ncbi:cobyrinate a,c-diamide synthase [Desulfovibrio mangrovi]|uniref:cobyrinate a,c-diamide synthase n=1 Tax=Desulfovibrio mangrovi TaxID=2976983 RepID=UPI0022467182|nr:cobyrinate a,c-diamide synthase [Desulfovibrio mangrovi]UZP66844.1 cobyrinate a,c-diamide synthase [Desulfovibrio mangrovi]